MGFGNYVHLDFLIIEAETEKAFRIRFDLEHAAEWIPKSQVADPDDYEAGDENGSISITEWIANEKGLE
jgi:hypothetical protein